MTSRLSEVSLNRTRRRGPVNKARSMNDAKAKIARVRTEIKRFFMTAPSSDIANVGFRLYSFEDLRKNARVKITGTDSMNGINSTLTGTSDLNSVCKTCHGDIQTCPGHIGYIELVEPIVYPARYFVTDIVNLLKSICTDCGSLVLSKESIEEIVRYLPQDESRRLAAIAKESAIAKTCHNNPDCRKMSGIRGDVKDKIPFFYHSGGPNRPKVPIPTSDILRIFDSVSEEDAEILGYKGEAHPRNLILQGIAVIPPCSRPPAMTATGELKISILTELYNRILVANEDLRKSQNKDTTALSTAVYNLMFRGSTDHTIPDNVSIKTKITHKYNGVIRGNINGKNIVNSGRGVVICDPNLKFGEIGFPRELARRMTVSEQVTTSNQTRLNTLLRRGMISKYRPLSDPVRAVYEYNVTENTRYTINLQVNDVVERQLMEGDYVLSFRQPVLTKLSMLGNRIVLKDGYTFSCHMGETAARNMDFDGDEVNAHAPTDIASMEQVATYISSRVNIMDARNNMVSMAVVYDGLIAIYLMMTAEIQPDVDEFHELLSSITNKRDLYTLKDRAREVGVDDLLTYRMLFSALLPADLYYKKNDVVIVNGILIQGIVGKNHVGHARDTIIQQILLTYGDQRAADFITDIYFLLTTFLTKRGFSAGYKDILTNPEVEQHIKDELSVLNDNIEAINLISADENNIQSRYIEKRIIENISNYTERLYKYNKDHALPDNRFIIMIDSGAKGKHAEYGGITSFVGQKYSQGGRMKRQLSDYTRSSIYFRPEDNSLSARGFIMNSYTSGLTPQELLFNQIGARDDIITMMMGTPDVGSLSHQMTRAFENMKTDFGNVINPDGKLVQTMYGGDGMDAERMTAVKTPMGHVNTFTNVKRIIGEINTISGLMNTSAEGIREDVEFVDDNEIEFPEDAYDD